MARVDFESTYVCGSNEPRVQWPSEEGAAGEESVLLRGERGQDGEVAR